jgi:hypothetical protein
MRDPSPTPESAEYARREQLTHRLLKFCHAPDRASLNELTIWDCRMLIEFMASLD